MRDTPFDLVFGAIADERFPALRASLEGEDAADRDLFLMKPEAIQLVRDLRPEEGMGEAIDQLVSLVHHAYLYWAAGRRVVDVDSALLDGTPPDMSDGDVPPAWYARFPERRVWAQVVEGAPPEPLDGCFAHAMPGGGLRVLGVFGLHPDRPGFSVVEVAGPRASALVREDGTPLFSSRLEGGAQAGLRSIAGEEELLELGWRTRAGAAAA